MTPVSILEGARDPGVCSIQADRLAHAVGQLDGARTPASLILRAYLHTAVLSGGGVDQVEIWARAEEVDEPAAILHGAGPVARYWAEDMERARDPDAFELVRRGLQRARVELPGG
jgi:hypothetical protein